jgi:hypothetical protein
MGGSIESLIAAELARAGVDVEGFSPQVQSIAMARVRSGGKTAELAKTAVRKKKLPLSSRQIMISRSINLGGL